MKISDKLNGNRPKKIVEPVLALSFGVAIIAGLFFDKVSAETFVGIAGPVIGFYFNTRGKEKGND